ncbi:hypothetical protein [Dactylosporangium darangshiense]|uniref:hypothetical protein n=1 Tax=Dactylosporangium darangshiense TaxID=579108 RepID=UPI0031EFFB5B
MPLADASRPCCDNTRQCLGVGAVPVPAGSYPEMNYVCADGHAQGAVSLAMTRRGASVSEIA